MKNPKHIGGPASAALNVKIAELAERGMTGQAISEELGQTVDMVRARLSRMRRKNQLKPAILCRDRTIHSRVANHAAKFKRALGTMTMLMECLSEEQIAWLFGQTPKDMRVAEIVAAMIKDAYQDEVEK